MSLIHHVSITHIFNDTIIFIQHRLLVTYGRFRRTDVPPGRFVHKLCGMRHPVLGMQSGTARHARIFDKMDIINVITNTYSCSIKAVDTRYGNTIYSTGFHCARFQHPVPVKDDLP